MSEYSHWKFQYSYIIISNKVSKHSLLQAKLSSKLHLKMQVFYIYIYIFIYLLTAIGLSPGGSTHLHTNNI
jgi:hypothetical protein